MKVVKKKKKSPYQYNPPCCFFISPKDWANIVISKTAGRFNSGFVVDVYGNIRIFGRMVLPFSKLNDGEGLYVSHKGLKPFRYQNNLRSKIKILKEVTKEQL